MAQSTQRPGCCQASNRSPGQRSQAGVELAAVADATSTLLLQHSPTKTNRGLRLKELILSQLLVEERLSSLRFGMH